MAIPAIQNAPHLDRVDLLKFQYQEKLNKLTFIARIISLIASGIIGGVLGVLYAFPANYLLTRFQISPFNFLAFYFGGAALYVLGLFKLWDRWEIDAKIERLIDSFLAPYQITYNDLNNPAFTAFAHRAEALNVDMITEANQCWHNRLR
jgi:H+/Cl- antiporter ClcA